MESPKGTIYFDGLCVACSTEINHYRKQKGSEKFSFLDITNSEFQPEAHGIDPYLVHKVMHVRDPQGQLHQGVDAFRAIWRELPRYHFLYRLSERPSIRKLLELGYGAFVHLRPYLPRRRKECADSPYCDLKNN